MKELKLSKDQFAMVDDEDFEKLNIHRWSARKQIRKNRTYFYVLRRGTDRKCIYLHREILNTKSIIDHIDGNPLNNQKSNLRITTPSLNAANRVKSNGTSKYKGVSWRKARSRWIAEIRVNYKGIRLGHFKNQEDAAKAYDKAAIKYFGEFANTNFK